MKKTAAGIALLATAGLVAGPMAGMSQAWAVQTGDVKITAGTNNAVKDYNAFCIFTGTVGNNGKLSDIKWSSDAVRDAVCPLLNITATDADSAQQAADAISKLASEGGEGKHVVADSKLMAIAKAVQTAGTAQAVNAGEATKLNETGYYVFMTKSFNTDAKNNASTAPIFATIGTAGLTVTEKIAVPTVTKTVADDDEDKAAGKRADANFDQKLTFTLDGTLPSNLDSYDTYYYAFHDTMTGFNTVDADDVVVKIDGTPVTEGFTVTPAADKLDVVFTDIKTVAGAAAGAHVTVEYKASLDDTTAAIAGEGNKNEVYIEYSNNPTKDEKGTSTPDEAKVYSYALKLNKVDSLNAAQKLKGAHFQVLDETSTVVAEGTTDDNGIIEFKGLDTGTYTVKETVAPDGYQLAKDFTVTITDSTTTAAAPTIAVSKGENAPHASMADTPAEGFQGEVTVKDDSMILLPVTGMGGFALFTLVGGGIVVASGIGIARSRRKSNED